MFMGIKTTIKRTTGLFLEKKQANFVMPINTCILHL